MEKNREKSDELAVLRVVAALDGKKITPCYEFGEVSLCTKQLTGKVFRIRSTGGLIEACSYHEEPLLNDPNGWPYQFDLGDSE